MTNLLDNLTKKNDTLENFIEIIDQKEVYKIIALNIIELIKSKPKALIGLSSIIDFSKVYDQLSRFNSKEIFHNTTFAILSEEIIVNKKSRFDNLLVNFLEKLDINFKNLWTPIRSIKEKEAKKEVLNFSKKILDKKNFDLIIINYNLDNNELELVNVDFLQKEENHKSFTFIKGEAQVASIGWKEIINSKKIIVVINSKKNYSSLQDSFKNQKISDINFLATLSTSLSKTNFYLSIKDFDLDYLKDQKNLKSKKIEFRHHSTFKVNKNETWLKEFQIKTILNKDGLIQFPKNKKESVFYDDEFINDEKKLLEYQVNLKQKIFKINHKTNVLKNIHVDNKETKLKNPTVKIHAKVFKN